MSALPHNLSSDATSGRGKCLPCHLPRGGGQEITRWGMGGCQACRGWKCSLWLPAAAAGGRGTVARTLRWVPAAASGRGRARLPPGLPGAEGAPACSGWVPGAGEENASWGCLVLLRLPLSWPVFPEGEEGVPP